MTEQAKKDQKQIQRLIWSFLLFTWLLRWWQGLLFYQLQNAPFVSVEADNTFWLIHALQTPYYSIHSLPLAILLDFSWLFICLYSLWTKHNRILSILMAMVFFNYFITYNSVATHHEHTLVGLLFFIPLLFVKSLKNFTLLFATVRYYTVFALFAAGFWKVWRGSILHPNQMSEILKRQHLDYLISYPKTSFSNIITYLIEHPGISNGLWHSAWVIEIAFIIGFFTRKFDKLLGLGVLLFFFFDYLLMNLFFLEFCIFAFAFYPWKGIWDYYDTNLAKKKYST